MSCQECGAGSKLRKGLCSPCYQRARRRSMGVPPRATPSIERAMARLHLDGDCVVWDGKGLDNNGYPQVYGEGKQKRVHVVFWEYFNGPVPDGLELDHYCKRFGKLCVAHLEPVTHAENIRRAKA